jgi:hypothetical protein
MDMYREIILLKKMLGLVKNYIFVLTYQYIDETIPPSKYFFNIFIFTRI